MCGKQNKLKNSKRETMTAYLFTVPSFLGFLFFVLIPVIWVLVISFQNYNAFTGETTFAGLENFKTILSDNRSVAALKNTLWYTIMCSIGNTGLGLVLAVLVDDILPKKISVFFRSIYFFPSLVGLHLWQLSGRHFFKLMQAL